MVIVDLIMVSTSIASQRLAARDAYQGMKCPALLLYIGRPQNCYSTAHTKRNWLYVTCSEKRDLPEFFMNIIIEILAWIDSPVYAEYNGASLKEKY